MTIALIQLAGAMGCVLIPIAFALLYNLREN